mmetsp:Transcript_16872/g.38111  ORF Transcript_16872/g.38111 Transcript_16872/m.38111 type:complete len:245 (+) Transcript_16872:733-1467(+)
MWLRQSVFGHCQSFGMSPPCMPLSGCGGCSMPSMPKSMASSPVASVGTAESLLAPHEGQDVRLAKTFLVWLMQLEFGHCQSPEVSPLNHFPDFGCWTGVPPIMPPVMPPIMPPIMPPQHSFPLGAAAAASMPATLVSFSAPHEGHDVRLAKTIFVWLRQATFGHAQSPGMSPPNMPLSAFGCCMPKPAIVPPQPMFPAACCCGSSPFAEPHFGQLDLVPKTIFVWFQQDALGHGQSAGLSSMAP